MDMVIAYKLAVERILENASEEQLKELATAMECDEEQVAWNLAEYIADNVKSYVDDDYIIHIEPDTWDYPQFKVVNMEMLLIIAKN